MTSAVEPALNAAAEGAAGPVGSLSELSEQPQTVIQTANNAK